MSQDNNKRGLSPLRAVAFGLVAVVAGQAARRYMVAGPGVLAKGDPFIHGVWVLLQMVGVVLIVWGVTTVAYRRTERARLREKYGDGGWATARHLRKRVSARAMRKRGVSVRPELSARPKAERRKLANSEFGVRMGTTQVGPMRGYTTYASYGDVVLLIAPPQTGKSATLGGFIIEAPGAVLSTSTKADVYSHTAALRVKVGPLLTFNPEGVGNLPSTFRWSPITGCGDSRIAEERALHLVDGAKAADGLQDKGFWDDKARMILRVYLMAAVVAGRDMRQVAAWVNDPTDMTPLQILRHHRADVPAGWEQELAQVLQTEAGRTRDSIFMTLAGSVAFMGDPVVAAMCCPEPSDPQFDVAGFLKSKATLYLLGGERAGSRIAPLLSALTGYTFEESKRLASQATIFDRKSQQWRPTGKLDPPLSLVLDEAGLITPVPLDRWTSDAGGRSIHITIAVQSPSQLRERWGDDGAKTIENNSNMALYYGGLKVDEDLQRISNMCGPRHERATTHHQGHDGKKSRSHSMVTRPTITPDRVRTLPQWHALVVYRDMEPTIVKVTPVWERRDVIAARKAGVPIATPPPRPSTVTEGAVPGQGGRP